ncbi:contractile injection system tape measure protein [Phocaeicola barnesiae]|uniref:contractile injection system tape measure protein n=1 Tax=Phocaeicola barnesiae TaxID=376804 RepID=UPI00241D323B|nr:contractile injection system tape measure protein [Phocaeicola barnesiae]
MIRIDHISFGFAVPDEGFARGLYADWDGFCHRCFTQVAEECLAPYGNDKALYELERLDLDLGSIPEEDFYDEYPRRLREALLAALPPLYGTRMQPDPERTAAARMDNLLHYLKYGHPQPEWADKTFDPQEETDWLAGQPAAFYYSAIEKLAALCAEDGHAMRRLLWQAAGGKLLLDLYTAVLALPSAGLQGKRCFLSLLLEAKPDIPLRFVHGTQDGNGLYGMAELLDSLSVRTLMREETGEHAEVDLPPYWHYLYEWLIHYYPFNGLAIFGGKAEFTRHLHHRLLTFIRKRNYSFYLSKAELTVSFLLEVFGPAYYIDVLNAIYELQPHNPDGSPIYDNYFNRELYRMFLRLSLLRLPRTATSPDVPGTNKEKEESIPTDTEALTLWLKDALHNEAEKRTLLATLAKEQPELLIGWLRSEARKDDTLLPLLAPLIADASINRLLASVSLTALETAEAVKKYLQGHRTEIPWLKGMTDTRQEQALRKSVLRWMAEADLNRAEAAETLLQIFYQKATGKSDETAVRDLAAELELTEIRREHAPVKKSDTEKYMEHLRAILSDTSIPETLRRREVAHFWDTYREDYPEAVRLLHTQGLLPAVLELTGHYAYMEIMRKSLPQVRVGEKAETLLPLLEWIVRNEETLSPYLADKSTGLRTQLLLWIVRQGQGTANARSLLAGLFGGANLPPVLGLMTRDIDSEEFIDIENILARWQSSLPSAYKEWLHVMEDDTRAVRILQESRWQTAEDFGEWLGDTSIPDGKKRELLRTAATEYPQKWTTLLRGFGKEGKDIRRIAVHLPASVLLQSIGRGSFHQAAVLSRLVSLTERRAETFPFLFAGGKDFQSTLSEALLLYMQNADTIGRTLTEKDIVEKFLACLHFVHTGKWEYAGDAEWQQLSDILNNAMGTEGLSGQENEMSETLSGMDNGDAAWRHKLETIIYRHPDKLLAWMEDVATDKDIERLADAADIDWLTQWAGYLPTVAGFAHPDAFRQWTAWLLHLAASGIISAKELAKALCAWVKGADWKRRTPQQMERYFLSKLHIGNTDSIALPLESLTDASLPEAIRQRLLQDFLRLHPDKLLEYIHQTTAQGIMSIGQWIGMLDTDGWMRLASGLSLSATELLHQVSGILHLDDEAECLAWATCVIKEDRETWLYNRPEEHVRPFVQVAMPRQGDAEKKEALIQVLEKLHIVETEDTEQEPEIIWVGNAGLCLLAPWFVRLFAMLGYLDEERKAFKDTASKVRAVFLLQYLSCGQERDWREPELAFSRLLTALPGNVPLPKRLALSKEERQTADGMVTGVKANWPKMDGTSVEGFRRSFLLRGGTLEQEEGRWLLTVEEKAYDILLETIPWGFRQVRLPWLKKYVQVKWHEKQEF